MAKQVQNLAATATRNYGKNSFIPKPFEHIYTCNTGDVIPAFATIQINPGSTWKITTSILARLNTSRYMTIARGWIEYMWCYVPHFQIWDHWNNLMGENTESAWVSPTAYKVPKVSIPTGKPIKNGSVLDHFGWPTGQAEFKASALKLRAYNWICDQIWRDQNIEEPFAPLTGDDDIIYDPDGNWTVGGKPYQINRKADYFSTALPEPQKGPDVLIPLGSDYPGIKITEQQQAQVDPNETIMIRNAKTGGATGTSEIGTIGWYKNISDSTKTQNSAFNLEIKMPKLQQIRDSITTLHIYERDSRSGTRAPEMLWARWGVEVDVLELGRPRILNMGRFPIEFNQVTQTSATDTTSPQGTITAFGYTNNRSEQETFSFKYAGTLMCLVAIRFEHKYQYGIPQEDMKEDRFDFWHPEFAGLGDQPIYDYELWATGGANGTMATKSIFGYAERGAEYKNYMSLITGQIRSNYEQTMDYVHMADKYEEMPTLSNAWMKENPSNTDRTIFVTSENANQWLVDFVAEFEITDTIPLHSIPGIDRI